ncbi:ABC transporter ATP-binding protein|uniref:ATP-binding cassette, subfamily B n=1 Tax=Dendrosporobacter quercicolus TaxID=146817 RepID=A0A1G9NQR2_9FIRM|nr:ABC transporter ATP-binding protein [Dendrosporobacter quercicolus]NSL47409.1 ABC transporter ATP-binding protein [Dendrosporobacter quercicolus DSM 1736]SDL88377.1 ATP-binding cassette, subfamily B [Dendrosporobacter quercicolus]
MKHKEPKAKAGLFRLMELAGSRKGQLTGACALSVLAAAARLVPFFTIYGLLRQIVLHYHNLSAIPMSTVLWLVGTTAVAAVAYGGFGFASSSLSHRAAYNILYELRVQLMEKLSRLPAGYFTGTTQGALKKVVQDDVEQIEEFIAHNIADTVSAIALPVFTLAYLFIMDWRLALCTIFPLVICIVVLSAGLKNPKGAKTQLDMHETREAMNGTIVEYVHGMPVIKVFNRTLSAFGRLGKSIDDFSAAVKRAAYFFAPRMGVYFAAMGAQLLLILPAGLLIGLNASSYTDFLPLLLLFFLVGAGLKEPLENMMALALSTKNIAIGVARIDKILAEKEIAAPTSSVLPQSCDITFDHVQFSYNEDGLMAVNDISFALRQNTITGLVGPSGGGKSTVAQLLLRFYEPQAGRITIGGVDIKDIAPGKLMENVGYVFQDSVLFRDTVEGNIRMGNSEATRAEVEAAAKAAAIHDVIMALPMGYDTVIGEDNAYLSGGEKQRIAIARVFLKKPPIILLDEATAYADAENESLIQEAFAKLAEGKTVLIIAHRLKTIENADQILVLDNGRLMASGTHGSLLASSAAYRRMVDANERRDTWRIRKTLRKEAACHA